MAVAERECGPAAAVLERGIVGLRRRKRVGLVLETADCDDAHPLPLLDPRTGERIQIRAHPQTAGMST